MSPAPPHYALRIATFYAGFFTVSGVYLPFFPIWLAYRDLTPDEIAACITLPLLLRVLLTPAAAWFADRAPNRRFAIRVLMGLAFVVFAAAGFVDGFWPILLVTSAAVLLWNLALPAAEALALTGVRRYGLDFGRMRRFGSLAFIVANLGSGAILGSFSPESIYWALVAVFFVAALTTLTLPVTPKAVRALDDAGRLAAPSARAVLGHPVFLALMTAGGLMQASHAVLYGFGSLMWESRGYSGTEIGIFWATGVVAEILLFSFSGAVGRRIGATGLMGIAAAGGLVRWFLMPWDLGTGGYIALQLLHGMSFGASFLAIQVAILTRIPEANTVGAQGIAAMLNGILMAGGTAVSGALYRNFGPEAFWAMLLPCAAALAITIVCRMKDGPLIREATP